MTDLQYDRTLVGGLKLAEHVDATLSLIDESATLKELAGSLTKPMSSTAAGDLKQMLEVGYAAKVIEMSVDQSVGGSPGNVVVGDTYTGATSLAVVTVVWQNDAGGVAEMVCEKVSGTLQDGEALTGSNSNTGAIVSGSLVLAPGGGDAKYQGETVFGAEAGSGVAVYDAIIAATDGLTALRDEYAKLFQGG